MTTFQESKDQIEQKMLLKLMSRLEDDPVVSQRHIATELGIALGLVNTYLKRCIKKGWVRASQVPAKRLAYFLTPEGFKEKSRMVKNYIAGSLLFFRDARTQCEAIFAECLKKGWTRIALVGAGDLAEIVNLVAQGSQIKVEQTTAAKTNNFNQYDAVLITDIQQPQKIYDQLKQRVASDRLLFLDLLHISHNPPVEEIIEGAVG